MRKIWFLAAVHVISLFVAKGGEITDVPEAEVQRLGLDTSFYKKYLSFRGFPIVSSEKVSDRAFHEAAYLIGKMLGERQDILDAIIEQKIRLAIMAPSEYTTDIPEHSDLKPAAYWNKRARGLGATLERPAVSVGEENLLGYKGDPYAVESIFVHEFAHVIHQFGIKRIDPGFQQRLEQSFNRATLKGLWRSKYAGTNPSEYWAEGVQSWFDTNRENDFEHNHVNTRDELKEYDPELAALIAEYLGDGEWRYTKPSERMDSEHLSGLNYEEAPQFKWPEKLLAAYREIEEGVNLENIPLSPMDQFHQGKDLSAGGPPVKLRFDNRSSRRMSFFWVGYDGKRRHYGDIDPGRHAEQSTYGSHLWILVDESGNDYGWVRAADRDCRVSIE